MLDEEILRSIDQQLGDISALVKLVYRREISQAKSEVLGDGTRRKIYNMCDGQTSVKAIANSLQISPPAVSQHLSVLLDAGLVAMEGDGPRRFYVKRLER